MAARKRKRNFVDPKVQGALIFRVAVYWILCTLGIFILLAGVPVVVCAIGLPDPPPATQLIYQTWLNFWPAVCASLLLLPIVLTDVIRLSNRFAGPAFKLRRALRDLADGKEVGTLQFREKDFWGDFAVDFNRVAELVRSQREQQLNSPERQRETTEKNIDSAV